MYMKVSLLQVSMHVSVVLSVKVRVKVNQSGF